MSIKLTRRTLIRTGAAAAALPLIGAPAIAQGWPNKPIKFIVSYPPGGATDIFARAYGDYISKQLGQTVVVENKAGAGGTVGAVEVKRSAPDGYTLLFTISTTMIMNKVLYKNLPYDPDKDFVLISYMPAGSLPTIVATSTGITNLNEFAEYARKNKTNVGTYAAGSYAHLVVAELNKHYGLNMEAVHYRGESPMWADFLAGSLQGGTGRLVRRAERAPDRQGTRHRRVAEAHEEVARRADVCRAGRDVERVRPAGLRVRCRDRQACRTKSSIASRTSSSRRARAKRSSSCSISSASTIPQLAAWAFRSSSRKKGQSG